MDERVLKWLKVNKGKVFASPRNEVFRGQTRDFELSGIVDDRVNVRFVGSKYRALPLYFWMFDRTLKYIQENKSRAVRLGARLVPPMNLTLLRDRFGKNPIRRGMHHIRQRLMFATFSSWQVLWSMF